MKSNVVTMAVKKRETSLVKVAEDKPKPRKQKTAIKLFAVVAMVYAGSAVVSFGQQFFQLQGINQNIDRIQQDINTMREKNKQLSMEIKRLQSDTYIERVAREQLGLVKPGETVLLKAKISEQKPVPKQTVVDVRE